MAEVRTVVTGEWRENCHILSGPDGRAVVIDPGEDTDAIVAALEDAAVAAILCTHAHYDHIGSVADLAARHGAPFHLHAGDHKLLRQANFYRTIFGGHRHIAIPAVDVDLAGCDSLRLAGLDIAVVHTPGHTAGSVSFVIEGRLFSGDTLLGDRLGRTDLPGSDRAALEESVRTLLRLPGDTMVHPGHGRARRLAEIAEALEPSRVAR